MGRKSLAVAAFAFFGTGTTVVDFHEVGQTPELRQWLYSVARWGARTERRFFRASAGMRSGPGAFPDLSFPMA